MQNYAIGMQMAVKLDNLPVFLSYRSIFQYFCLIENKRSKMKKGVEYCSL